VRTIVRFGQAEKFCVVYVASTALKKRGRVFVRAALAAFSEDGLKHVCRLGERRYTQRDEAYWHALGFATLLIKPSGSYVLNASPGKRTPGLPKDIPSLYGSLHGGTLRGNSVNRLCRWIAKVRLVG
jgi:hypothetical protein